MAFGLRRVEPHEMGTGGVARTLLMMAVPSMVAGLLATTFQLVDTLFISWLGEPQVRGVAMAMPVLFVIFAIGQAAAIGVATLVSRLIGQREPEGARSVLEQALLASLVIGGLVSMLSPVLAWPILMAMKTPPDSLHFGELYMSRILLGVVLFHVGLTADAGLRAQGNTMTGMRIAVLANVLNLLLDGFFIFGPDNLPAGMPHAWGAGRFLADLFTMWGLNLGVQGGATATVLSRLLGTALLLVSLWSRRSHVRPFVPWRGLPRFDGRVLREVYRLGFPATVSILGMSASAALVNVILVGLDPTAVPAFFIAHRLEMFAFMPMFALGGAVVPMVGYNLGASNIARCRRIIVTSCVLAGGLMAPIGLVLFLFPEAFLGIFGPEPSMLQMGTAYLRINTLSYAIVGCDIMLSNGLQGLGRPDLSMLAQLLRTVIVKLPGAWLLGMAVGVTGVWISSPVSTATCFIFASMVTWWLLKRLSSRVAPWADENVQTAGAGSNGQ